MVETYIVSVIIPTYNRVDLIVRAIDSIQNQSLASSAIEIIVVDDGSEEDIAGAVNSLEDRRIRCIRHDANLGASTARNTGIREAQGKYVAFLDSDDVWHQDKLKEQLAAIERQPVGDRERLVCYGKFAVTPNTFFKSSILPKRGKYKHETVADYLWLAGGEMLTSTLLLDRRLAAATQFKPHLTKHQDLDFVLRLEQQGAKFLFVPQQLATWSNDARRERISNRANYEFSLGWIESYRGEISARVIQGFIVKEIVPKMLLDERFKTRGIELLQQGYRLKAISLRAYLFMSLKQAVPHHYQSWFKSGLRKIECLLMRAEKNFIA